MRYRLRLALAVLCAFAVTPGFADDRQRAPSNPLAPPAPGRRSAPREGGSRLSPSPVATFSILGFDPETGEIGGAVQSRVFSAGNGVLWAEADTGVVATQAIVD